MATFSRIVFSDWLSQLVNSRIVNWFLVMNGSSTTADNGFLFVCFDARSGNKVAVGSLMTADGYSWLNRTGWWFRLIFNHSWGSWLRWAYSWDGIDSVPSIRYQPRNVVMMFDGRSTWFILFVQINWSVLRILCWKLAGELMADGHQEQVRIECE